MNDATASCAGRAAGSEPAEPGRSAGAAGPAVLAGEEIRTHLERGTLTVHGRIPDASNAVLFGEVEHEGRTVPCVYKPVAGERPLWDFPEGTLAQREVAAYEVSRATGWDLIPATVLRDGPYGEGMCQAWVGEVPSPEEDEGEGVEEAEEEDGEEGGPYGEVSGDEAEFAEGEPTGSEAGGHERAGGRKEAEADGQDGDGGAERPLLALVEGEEPGDGWKAVGFAEVGPGRPALLVHADDERLRRLAVLDAVINNADRKGGHLLPVPGGVLYAIDHGVTFHADDKLRTLLWGWAGEELTAEALEVVRRLSADLAEGAPLAVRLAGLITDTELEAVRKRAAELASSGRHPMPGGDWPAIPWPPV
jgi:hypothetical protein